MPTGGNSPFGPAVYRPPIPFLRRSHSHSVTPNPPVRPTHRGRLAFAILASLIAHTLVLGVLATRSTGESRKPASTVLNARLAHTTTSPSTATTTRPPQVRRATPHAVADFPIAQPDTPTQPTAHTTAEPSSAALAEIPAYYLPLASLTREPELLTEVSPDGWPLLPDSPTGVFRLELAINPDGHIDQVLTHCEPRLCPAAESYALVVRGWQFQPAEILGQAVPSRLTLEFELGDPPPNTTQAPRQ